MDPETTSMDGLVPLVAVFRGEGLERLHAGAVAMVDSAGRLLGAAGDVDRPFFLRSAAKPFQLLPLIESGAADRFRFPAVELAVMAGSHSGQAEHVGVVESILKRAAIGKDLLRCGTHVPFHRGTARALLRNGGRPDVLQNNCSGKHAGMLALARHIGAPLDGYTEPGHPVQKLCLEALASCCGIDPAEVMVARDGCTVPTFAASLRAAALGYARLMQPGSLPDRRAAALGRVGAAMLGHPLMVAGSDRICTDTMEAFPGSVVVKVGAEGFIAAGFRRGETGVGVALKVADGDTGAVRAAAFLEALRQAGDFAPAGIDSVRRRHVPEVLTLRHQPAGRVTPVFRMNGR